MQTLLELFLNSVKEFPEEIAVSSSNSSGIKIELSRTQILHFSLILAEKLKEMGLEEGQTVAMFSSNRPEWSVGFFGVLFASGVIVPLDINLSDKEISNILNRSMTEFILADEVHIERIQELQEILGKSLKALPVKDFCYAKYSVPSKTMERKAKPEDLAIISFSSGTTGIPKGVMLTHRNIASNVRAVLEIFDCNKKDIFLSILPLHHMFESTVGFLLPLISGARVHYLSSLNPRVLGESMLDQKVTICLMVPAVVRLIHKRIFNEVENLPVLKRVLFSFLFSFSRYLLSRFGFRLGSKIFPKVKDSLSPNLRYLVSGGAALNAGILIDMIALGIEVIQGYGLTETSPVTNSSLPGIRRFFDAVGPPIPGVEVRIQSVDSMEEKEGEIWIKGPNVMKGYYQNVELTNQVFSGEWFKTGDIGRVDEYGNLTVCGRIKNVIINEMGKNIYPEEIEEELLKNPFFQEVCVMGKKTKTGSEEVFAVVLLEEELHKGNSALERLQHVENEVKKSLDSMADYKKITDFFVWPDESLPKTTTLKNKREELKIALIKKHGFLKTDF
ncbi:MAG: AMP-binding protein [Nitrospinota bacterium]|nr:AMP-binding protein [Nitrospinota bacterium]